MKPPPTIIAFRRDASGTTLLFSDGVERIEPNAQPFPPDEAFTRAVDRPKPRLVARTTTKRGAS